MSSGVRQLPVFVYGTLRPGEKYYGRYLAGRTQQEIPATASGRLYFVAADGGYPYLEKGEGSVRGELVFLKPEGYAETLRRLDELEEYNPQDEAHSLYLRRPATVALADGSQVTAWVYYWNGAAGLGARIDGGDYRRRAGRSPA
jgi:gamma-glutamylcyclotransferase (GGCT)/AIG2-like uncharacterized protein YtfP